MDWLILALRAAAFALGGVMVWGTLASVIKTFILPRSAPDFLTRIVFVSTRAVFRLRLRWARTYAAQDAVLSFLAPVSLSPVSSRHRAMHGI